jgi:hypothetical protein
VKANRERGDCENISLTDDSVEDMKSFVNYCKDVLVYGMKGEIAKRFLVVALLLSITTYLGCSGNRAAELYDTARFEEKQNNREHAVQLYKEIMKKYPDSPYAGSAAERLADMDDDSGSTSSRDRN